MDQSIIKSTMIIVVVTMVGRLLGFVRNIFITNEFGPGMETDAYIMAFTIPFTLFLVIPGAINSVFIPTMKGLMGDHLVKERNDLFQKTITVTLLLFALLTLIGMFFSRELISLLASGFEPQKQQLTVELLNIMMPSTLFIALIAVLSSVLNVHNEFFAPSLGTVINSLIVILSIYTLVPFLGIHGLAWGTLLGFIMYSIYLIAPVYRRNYKMKWSISVSQDPLMRGMGERFIPILIGMVISQLYLLLERFLVSGLGDQKLTSLFLANSIVQLPVAIFAGALAVPLFPLLSEYVKASQMEQMKEIMRKGLLYQFHLLLPTTIGLILLSEEIVRLFYAHSPEFTDEAVHYTAFATIFYSLGMLGLAGRDMLTRVFYSIENTKTPVLIGGVSLIAYVVLGNWLIPIFDHGGIALAFSLAAFLNFMIQSFFLRVQIGRLYTRRFYGSILKGAVGSGILILVLWLSRDVSSDFGLFQVPLLILLSVLLYFGLLIVMKEDLAKEILAKVLGRLRPKKSG